MGNQVVKLAHKVEIVRSNDTPPLNVHDCTLFLDKQKKHGFPDIYTFAFTHTPVQARYFQRVASQYFELS